MSEPLNELKWLGSDVHLDEKRDTFYLRQRGGSSPDIPKLTENLRQALEEAPANEAVRYLLATFLLTSNQRQEAEVELKQVAQSSDIVWAAKALQLLNQDFEP